MNTQITPEMSLFDITEKHPETVDVFVANGFDHVGDPEKRAKQGRLVTLQQAVQMKGKDLAAFTQLLEAFVSNRANPLTDGICRQGLMKAGHALPRAYIDGHDIAAREAMAQASLFGGMALANAGLGAVHGFAGPIGGMFEAPQFGRNGWLVDLNEYAEGDEGYMLDDIIPAVRDGLSYEGGLYAAPFYAESSFVMYRQDVLDAHEIDICHREERSLRRSDPPLCGGRLPRPCGAHSDRRCH